MTLIRGTANAKGESWRYQKGVKEAASQTEKTKKTAAGNLWD